MYPIPKAEPIPSIVELNKDVESFVIQASASRSRFFKDAYKPLQFVHLSDAHAVPELWSRMAEYINEYEDFISFALHTGDYCGGSQEAYADFYRDCTPCRRPIFNCVGNHDTLKVRGDKDGSCPKKDVRALLFNHTEGWDVSFMPGEGSMTYYKDFPESNLRLIVLDCYYDREQQAVWLTERLAEAREKGIHVITAAHEISHPIVKKANVTFQTLTDFESVGGNRAHRFFDEIIADFKRAGGIHVVHLAGHEHSDMFGHTERSVLNIAVECATNWDGWCDGKRVRGTKTYDCFNTVSVDTNLHLLKIVRIGDNADHYLRIKRTLCYDYKNQRVIFNG
ncbi:MAG: metallophosphoesterase [Clostridia bacterium]|nr:metallophosphoesterase [Clostridia bacterium]